jgi:type I restriction enzyme, S subunit
MATDSEDVRFASIMPELPERWLLLKWELCLNEIIYPPDSYKQSNYKGKGTYPIIDQGNSFIAGYTDEDNLLYKGVLPVIIFGDHTRAVKYIDFHFALGADGCKILFPIKAINIKFFYYYLLALNLSSSGYSRHYKYLKSISVPLPPLNEQKRIVEKLDAILPKVKNAKARLEKIPLILKKFRQSVLSAACSGRLTEDWRAGKEELPDVIAPNVTDEHDLDIPESWVVCIAKDACKNVESGSTPKGKPFTATGEIPYLKVYNIVNQNINFDYKPQFIPKTVHEKELKRCKCYPNDVLMNIVGPPLGKIALVTDQFPEWNINQALVVYRPHDFLNSLFLYYWLCSLEPIKETLKETRGSAGQVNISLTQARNIFVPLPPLEEQQEIVRRVEKLFALADSLEAKYKKAIQQVKKIEQSILVKAFKGELTDPDPTDEPASELLKRILDEKAKLESTKKSRSKRSAIPLQH